MFCIKAFFKKLRIKIMMWLFIHQMGKLHSAYLKQASQIEKAVLLTETFGKKAREVLDEMEYNKYLKTKV